MNNKTIKTDHSFGCLGFIELIGLIMLSLRCFGFIDWSWWIVLAPFYLPVAILILSFIIYLIEEKTRR